MINRIPFKCLLISSLSGLTRKRGMARTSLAIPTRFLVAPDKLDIKRHKHGILYIPLLWRPCHCRCRRRQQCLNIFSSETALPIKAKFYVVPPWEGGTKICINGPGHMTKMAAITIYGKNL